MLQKQGVHNISQSIKTCQNMFPQDEICKNVLSASLSDLKSKRTTNFVVISVHSRQLRIRKQILGHDPPAINYLRCLLLVLQYLM